MDQHRPRGPVAGARRRHRPPLPRLRGAEGKARRMTKRARARASARPFCAWVTALGVLFSAPARAEPEKRALPNYDGRGPSRTTPGQKALWVPRLLLSPLYFVSEFV